MEMLTMSELQIEEMTKRKGLQANDNIEVVDEEEEDENGRC